MSRKESLNNDINNISKAIHLLLVSIFGISAWGFVKLRKLGIWQNNPTFYRSVLTLRCGVHHHQKI
ncbi:hypothetical protein [Campylobacter sp.]|uniref:hypothetical protein n=1 Tax=Campylobacter sp. TaxID=205 RepID=UPI002AA7AEB3|nr:hypothetical protein [Campylobacter sp.]MCI6565419.1 hypothetical protein [Campylobacter sp.]